jgi:tetratricopeptide (TPR) repeat protein
MARYFLAQALALDPFNAYVCHTLSNLEIRSNNIPRAQEILKTVFDHKPTGAICIALAELEREHGSPAVAKKILQTGFEKCYDQRTEILLALAWLEEEAFQNPNEAYALLNQALIYDPKNVRAYLAKANMELRIKQYTKAKLTLQQAILLPSDDGKSYTMLGTLELESGNIDEARKILIEGTNLFPGDFYLLQRLGTLEAKYGNSEKARNIFRQAIKIHPHTPTFVAWAILEENLGNLVCSLKVCLFVFVSLSFCLFLSD